MRATPQTVGVESVTARRPPPPFDPDDGRAQAARSVRRVVDRIRFPIRFTGLNRALVVLGVTPSTSYVDVTPDELDVRMARAFRASVPRASVREVVQDTARVWGWGAHGWRGVWLINGSSSGLVRIELDPPARGSVLWLPIRVRVLRVALEDPVGFERALKPV
jgi:hypothetical protein